MNLSGEWAGVPSKSQKLPISSRVQSHYQGTSERLLKEAAPAIRDCADGASSQGEIAGPKIVIPFEETSPG